MAKNFDLLVLGTGNAGMAAAGAVREAGKTVAMIEHRDVGGTCPIRGCVPKKVLVAAAQTLHQIDLASQHHIKVGKPEIDWPALIEREQGFVDGVPGMFRDSLERRGIDLFEGSARFTGRNTVAVGDEVITADNIVIATGSVPRTLDIPGAEHMITSEEILTERGLPERIVFVGGGVIALEFGHVYARAGAHVTILEALPRLLPRMDEDAVAQIQKESERIGIDVLTGVEVTAISESGNGLEVRFTHDGAEKTVVGDRVANGTGRVPALDGLDLDAGEIAHDGLRITVGDDMRSVSNPAVHVAGDALWSSPQLSPVASYEGRIVGRNILDGSALAPEYGHIPANVYTVPALASVGLTEAEANAQGLDFATKTNDMTGWRSSMTHAEPVAWSKVLVEDGSGRIIGAHIVGHGAEEIIHLFAMAIRHGLGAADLGDMIFAYPTFASDVKFMV
jgi:glutathione reductase (NADPH)